MKGAPKFSTALHILSTRWFTVRLETSIHVDTCRGVRLASRGDDGLSRLQTGSIDIFSAASCRGYHTSMRNLATGPS